MPAIIVPRSQLVQPQGLSGINPDIPPPSLVFSGGQIYRGEQPVSNAAETAAGRGGRGVRNGAVVYTANADRYLSTTGGTALVVLSRVGAAQASTAFAFGTYNHATYRFSAHLTWSDGNVYFDFGGTFAPNRLVATSQAIDSTPAAFVLTAGPSGMRIFRDGRLIASSSTAPTRGNPTECFFGLGLDPTSGATPMSQVDTGATYYAQAFWPEQISDRIAEQLSADPWGLFKASPRRLYFDVPAGSDEVQADTAIRWNMQAAVSTAASIRWSLQQPVQKDAALRWSMLQPASADLIARWALQSIVSADQAFAWNQQQSVEQTQLIAWKLLQSAQADANLQWSMLAAVQSDVTALWNIAATLGIVSADLALRWSALAPVTALSLIHI